MKDLKRKLTSKTFWLSLVGAIVVALQCFGVKVDAPYVNEAVSAVCSVFIVLGIVKNDSVLPGSGEDEDESKQDEEHKDAT